MKSTKNVDTCTQAPTERHADNPAPKRYQPRTATFRFEQESDSCEKDPGGQDLTIELDNAGGGNFAILSTSRWAIDGDEASIAELAETIRWCLRLCEKQEGKP